MPIDSGSGLGAEVAVPGVEIECTDAVFAVDTLELYSTFDPIGGVVSHSLIVVLCSEEGRTTVGLSKVILRAAAVHFDADWDVGYRPIAHRRMSDASDVLGEEVNFGEVDWDREVELVMSLRVITVPTVAYYLHGNLVSVLPGARQNILGRLEQLLQGGQIGGDDGLGSDVAGPHFWCGEV
jgi:hypothetical protein